LYSHFWHGGLPITCSGFILLVSRVTVSRLQSLKITQGGKNVAAAAHLRGSDAAHFQRDLLQHTQDTQTPFKSHASPVDHPSEASTDSQVAGVPDHDTRRARRVGYTRVQDPPQASTQHRRRNPPKLGSYSECRVRRWLVPQASQGALDAARESTSKSVCRASSSR